MKQTKAAIRTQLRAKRRALSADFCQAAATRIAARLSEMPAYAAARSLVAYLPDENEVRTRRIIEDAVAHSRPVFLPRCDDTWQLVRWQPGDPLRQSRGGVFEPAAGAIEPVAKPSLALVPLVGWDCSGTRLGRGAGIYDRLLSSPLLCSEVTRVGLAYEFQEFPNLPSEQWDVRLHYLITEERLLEISSPTRSGKEV